MFGLKKVKHRKPLETLAAEFQQQEKELKWVLEILGQSSLIGSDMKESLLASCEGRQEKAAAFMIDQCSHLPPSE